jgi:hypothetical protein
MGKAVGVDLHTPDSGSIEAALSVEFAKSTVCGVGR